MNPTPDAVDVKGLEMVKVRLAGNPAATVAGSNTFLTFGGHWPVVVPFGIPTTVGVALSAEVLTLVAPVTLAAVF